MTNQQNPVASSANWTRRRKILLSFLLMLFGSERVVASGPSIAPQQNDAKQVANDEKEIGTLELGKPVERELAGGQSHFYRMALNAGQYLNLVVDQRGVDVVVRLLGPDGKTRIEVDSPNGTVGPEPLSMILEMTGQYRLEVRSLQKEAKPGRYEAKIIELRAATERDNELAEAGKLFDESEILRGKGAYEEAIPRAERSLALRIKALGEEHFDTQKSLNTLALLYGIKGEYRRAEPLFRRLLAISEKRLGPEHLATATVHNNLGALYVNEGDYRQAEISLAHALAIREKALGPDHPMTASSLSNLAMVFTLKGDYAKVEPILRRVLAINEKAFGAEHAETVNALYNLGAFYTQRGASEQAEPLLRRALDVAEKLLGAQHPFLANPLTALARNYSHKGEYAQAEPLFFRALAIREKTLGEWHPDTATALGHLATNYLMKSDFSHAEPLFYRVLAIREKALGLGHPDVAISLQNVSTLHEAKGEIAKTIALQLRAQAIEERNLGINLAAGSERQRLAYLTMLTGTASRTVSLHVRLAQEDPAARDLALTTILQRKGRVLDAMNDNIEALRLRANSQDQALFDRLKGERAKLARLVFGGFRGAPGAYPQSIKQLEESVEKLEAEIGERSREFRVQSQGVTLAAVQSAIPADAALVEFFVYRPFNAHFTRDEERFGKPCYVAYVLRQAGDAGWVELGEAQVIDDAVDALRQALHSPKNLNVKRAARRVDKLVMQPVRPLLGNTHTLLISPDGRLNLVPFAALADEQNRYLVERYSFTYLTSGRDLLRLRPEEHRPQAPMIIANPDFGEKPADRKPASAAGIPDLNDAYFPPLAATAEEANALKVLFPEATVLTGAQATETALKQAAGPGILHIATHGFFLSDEPQDGAGLERQRKLLQQTGELSALGARLENPLLRSGLGLAGANLRKSGDDDGILTAMEVAGLNLWGTRLVVLSACETGVGEVKTGEGVYGLRRALVLAGAETQVMSLWPVSDRGTRDLMIGYYQGLHEGQGRSEAMRRVQLQMLKSSHRRHPFYWASFIVSGEWANLEGKR